MYLLHYYVQRGWKIKDFLEEEPLERLFYYASMEIAMEEKQRMCPFGGE
ncbi:hypothetical protein AALB39_18150 [Lachnospiraceae bacterium 54-53]